MSTARAAKEHVMQILEELPDNASLEDIQYHIYVRQKIDHGLEDVEAGRTLSEEEFDLRIWTAAGALSNSCIFKRF